MSVPADLLEQAEHLLKREPRRPRQVSLRRAVSASYYALFHLLVDEASRLMVPGVRREPIRDAYRRTFNHAEMAAAARNFSGGTFPDVLAQARGTRALAPDLLLVARALVELQQARHTADYNLRVRLTRTQARLSVTLARQGMRAWRRVRGSSDADLFLVALASFKRMRP